MLHDILILLVGLCTVASTYSIITFKYQLLEPVYQVQPPEPTKFCAPYTSAAISLAFTVLVLFNLPIPGIVTTNSPGAYALGVTSF